MSNYKVKVNNEAESKEVQELFFELGFGWCGDVKYLRVLDGLYLYTYTKSKDITWGSIESTFNNHGNKEINLPKLRDMVVLKRNDVGDATHTDQDNWKWYIGADSYVWQAGNAQQLKQWDKSNLDHVDLKPIKEEMKEYLVKSQDGEWRLKTDLVGDPADEVIEIPEGADILAKVLDDLVFYQIGNPYGWYCDKQEAWFNCADFVLVEKMDHIIWQRDAKPMKEYLVPQSNGKYALTKATEKRVSDWVEVPEKWMDFVYKLPNGEFHYSDILDEAKVNQVVWQRHTQPEELPFIDDEPKYSDNPLLTQVGGDHYKSLPIQPVEFAMKNNLDYCQANAIKYIVRHANKNGKQDLEKAKHYIDLLIQYHYSEDA